MPCLENHFQCFSINKQNKEQLLYFFSNIFSALISFSNQDSASGLCHSCQKAAHPPRTAEKWKGSAVPHKAQLLNLAVASAFAIVNGILLLQVFKRIIKPNKNSINLQNIISYFSFSLKTSEHQLVPITYISGSSSAWFL